MTKQSRLDRFLSSIISTHIDPENSEVLENKKDTEISVDKILQLITEEESNTSSLNSLDKSELVSLIKDVHNGYEDLYKRYDNLTENLKKKFHRKEDHGWFSFQSSSDSDSSDSASEEDSSKQTSKRDFKGELKISLEKCKELQEQLETVNKQNDELHTDVTSLRAKISPYEIIEAKLEEAEATKIMLENKLQSLTKNIEFLQDEKRELKEQLSASLKGQEEVNKKICTIEEQNQALLSENSDALSKLHEAVKFAEGCKIEIQQMKDQILTMQSNNTHLNEALEQSTQEVVSLKQLLDNKSKEVEALRSKNFESKSKIEELEKFLIDQRDECTLNMKLASDGFSSKIAELLSDNGSVKSDLEAAKKRSSELSKALAEMEEMNEALKSDILRSSSQMKDMENTVNDLKMSSEMLKGENFKFLSKIQEFEKSLIDQQDEAILSMKLADHESSIKFTKMLTENESLNLDPEVDATKCNDSIKYLVDVQEENKGIKSDLLESTSRMQEMEKIVSNLKLSSETFKDENLKLLTKIQELEKSFTDHRDEATRSIQLANDEFSSKVTNLMTENERLKYDLDDATSKSCEMSRILAEVQEQNGALKSDLLASSSLMQDVEKTTSALKMSSEKFKDENSKLLDKINELEKSLTDQRDEATLNLKLANDEFSCKFAKLLSEKEKLKLDVEAASGKSSELSTDLAVAQEENEALKSDILKSTHRIQDIEKIVSDLKTSSEILKDENSNLLKVIDDLKQQLKDKEEKEKTLASDLIEAVKMTQEETEKGNKFSLQLEELRNKNFEVYEALRLQFEATMQESMKLKKVLETLTDEKSSLRSENQELLCRLKLADAEVETYKAQIEHLETDVSKLQDKIENLSLQLDSTKLQHAQINKELGSAAGQVEKLTLKSLRLVSELESKNALCKERENELGQLKNENLILKGKNELQEAEKTISNLRSEIKQLTGFNGRLHVKVDYLSHELETVNQQLAELNKQIRFSREENSELIKKLEYAEADSRIQGNNLEVLSKENSMLQQNNKDLDARNSYLEEELQTKSLELSNLQKDFEEAKNEATVQIQALILQVNGYLTNLRLLQQEKSELEFKLKTMSDIFLESQVLTTKLEAETISRISKQEGRLDIQKSKSRDLLKDLRRLKEQLQASREKLDIANTSGEKQIKQINKLSDIQKELTKKLKLYETEKAYASKELGRLQSEVEAGEVHLRLANQLLHITVGENKVKEEILQERGREMQESIQKLSAKLDLLQKEPRRIKEVVESRISGFWPELDKVELFFEKKHSQIERGLSTCIKEFYTLKAKLQEQLYEKQEMNGKIHKLTSTLKTSEENISILRSEAEDLRFQLARKNAETDQLIGRSSESDKRLQQVEKTMKEQAEELLIRNEEKREAIRQLCLQIDYYRDKCSQLYQNLLATQNQSRS